MDGFQRPAECWGGADPQRNTNMVVFPGCVERERERAALKHTGMHLKDSSSSSDLPPKISMDFSTVILDLMCVCFSTQAKT